MEKELNKKIDVRIIDFEYGMRHYDNINAIRIHDEKYRLLIMSDHAPILGEVNGSLYLLNDDEEIVLKDIHGFFSHVNNQFKIIQKDRK